jgi:hypothetical protein
MAGAMAGGVTMVWRGLLIDWAGWALFFDCDEVTGRMFIFCINGKLGCVCATAKTAYGNGRHYHCHEKGKIFYVKLSLHVSSKSDLFLVIQTYQKSR